MRGVAQRNVWVSANFIGPVIGVLMSHGNTVLIELTIWIVGSPSGELEILPVAVPREVTLILSVIKANPVILLSLKSFQENSGLDLLRFHLSLSKYGVMASKLV